MKGKRSSRRQSARLRALDRLTAMGRGVAHDFNNLLAAIQGNALVLERGLPPDFPDRDCLEQIADCTQRGLALTGRLLLYTGRAPFDARRLDLSEVVRGCAAELSSAAGSGQEITYALADGLPSFEGDVSQVGVLLTDLVANAAEAMVGRVSAPLRVATAACDCTAEDMRANVLGGTTLPGEYVCVSVADAGRGIPLRLQERVFDPFFSTKIRGRGLGLCVVLGIVRAHGGALRLQSRAYRGATFTALFPVA
jgi:signal transduction histidine kinase